MEILKEKIKQTKKSSFWKKFYFVKKFFAHLKMEYQYFSKISHKLKDLIELCKFEKFQSGITFSEYHFSIKQKLLFIIPTFLKNSFFLKKHQKQVFS